MTDDLRLAVSQKRGRQSQSLFGLLSYLRSEGVRFTTEHTISENQTRCILVSNATDAVRIRNALRETCHVENIASYKILNTQARQQEGSGDFAKVAVRCTHCSSAAVLFKVVLNTGEHAILDTYTNADGIAQIDSSDIRQILSIVAIPRHSHWPTTVDLSMQDIASGVEIVCNDLPVANNQEGWWHHVVGLHDSLPPTSLQSIRIGVIDSGCGPNASLQDCIDIGAFLGGDHHKADGDGYDIDAHGTHVCGIIGARPSSGDLYRGLASGAELYSARVIPDERSDANQVDIANAIEILHDRYSVDLINISLGSWSHSSTLDDAIDLAISSGTLLIAAAGNENRSVRWPARHKDVVGVAALAKQDEYPSSSCSSAACSRRHGANGKGGFSRAAFSNYGEEVNCCAPGVGIISTVPRRMPEDPDSPMQSFDGTSMAAPVVTGFLANILATNEPYTTSKRSLERFQTGMRLLEENCQDLFLDRRFQGKGMVCRQLT